MADRSISVKLQAEVGNYVQGIGRAKAATGDLITELSKSEQQRQNFQKLGSTMLVAGAGIAAGIGLATKAAIDWESAWAGVVKTVDGTEAQLAALEDELRQMARELPASHEEIAAVAEAAGQLGVATEDVADFTRTMIDMGTATNLSAEEAAVSIAQMANVMGTSVDDVDRLGAAVVDLGNNAATNEAAIVSMAQRIAGAGATIGLSEADVLGFSAALASVGINAEAGGSAISRAMISIETSVREGGDELDTLAQVAGMSADEFSRAYEQDAAQAIATFIAGLGRMKASGQDVFGVLEQLGFSEIRLRDALLRLAESGDLLTESLDRGEDAWDANLALTEEAEKRYGSTAAQLQIARNNLNDFAIEMGEIFLPAVAEAADKLGTFVQFLGGIPDPIQNVIGVLGAATAGLLLLGGTAIVGVTSLARYRQALVDLGAAGGVTSAASTRVARGMRRTVLWAGRATGALVALQLAGAAASAAFGEEFRPQMDAFTEGIARFGREGAVAGEAARILGEDFEDFAEALRVLGPEGVGPNIGNAIKAAIEWTGATDDMQGSLSRSREQVDAFDQALASLVQSGRQEEAADAFDRLSTLAEESGVSVERLKELFPGYAAALETAAEQGEITGEGMGELGDQAAGAAEDVEALTAAFDELFGIQMDIDRATIAYEQGLHDLMETIGETANTLNVQKEAGRENRTAILDQVDAIADLRQANIDAGESVADANARYQEQLDDLEDLLIQQGFNEEAVRELINAYRDIPEEVETQVKLDSAGAQGDLEALENALKRLPEQKHIDIVVRQTGRPNLRLERWGGVHTNADGGVYSAQGGLLRQANVFGPANPALYAFAEPETGGEAFIPMRGNRGRSLAILNTAASWYGARVVTDGDGGSASALRQAQQFRGAPTGGGGVGGSSPGPTYSSAQRYVFDFRGVPPGSEIERFTTMFREALRTNAAFRVDVRGS